MGEKVGIAGPSGSGKSSIFNALLRVAEISSGNILINNTSIGIFSIEQLRKQIGIIDKDPFIMKGTLRENIDPCR